MTIIDKGTGHPEERLPILKVVGKHCVRQLYVCPSCGQEMCKEQGGLVCTTPNCYYHVLPLPLRAIEKEGQ